MKAHLLSYVAIFVVVFTHFCSTSVIYTTEGEFIDKRGFSLSGLSKLGSLAKTSLSKLKSSSSKVSSSTKSATSSATKTSSSVSSLSSSLKKGWNWLKGKTSSSSSSSTKSSKKSSGKTATKASVKTATKATAKAATATKAKTTNTKHTSTASIKSSSEEEEEAAAAAKAKKTTAHTASTTHTSSTHTNSHHTTGTTTELSKSKKAWKKVIRGIEIAGSGILFLNLASPLLSGSDSDDDSAASSTYASATDEDSAAAATASTTIIVSTSLGECFIAGLTGYDTMAIASASAACVATGGTISNSANAMLQTITADLVLQNEIGQAQEAITDADADYYDDDDSVSVVYVTASATDAAVSATATATANAIASGNISDDYTVLNSSQATPAITSQITSVTAAPVSDETESVVYVTE